MGRGDTGSFLIGFSLGAAAGVLLAPHSGNKTRSLMMKAAADGRSAIQDHGKAAQSAVLAVVEQGKDYVTRRQRAAGEAVRQGARVFRAH